MWDPRSGWFYYQKRRGFRTKIRELRWCQGWMSWALASHLENVWRRHDVRGFPGRELSLDPAASRFERLYARMLGAPANGLRIRLRRVLPATAGEYRDILDAGCGSGRVLVRARQAASRRRRCSGSTATRSWSPGPTRSPRRAGLTNCRFDEGDVTRLDFDGEFDLVVSVDNLEHVEDDVSAMRDAAAGPCGPAAAWSSTCPATSGAGSSSGAG